MSIQNKRSRSRIYGSGAVVSTFFFLGILVLIVLIAERHPWRLDLTESGAFTLSEQTRKVLESIDESIQIKAFFASASPEEVQARDLLDTYRYYSKKIDYEFIDPDKRPEIARRYEVRSYGTLVFEGYRRKQTIQNAEEESVTNALLKLVQGGQKKIYFLTGHGEHSLKDFNKQGYSSVQSALEKENYQVEELNLMQKAQVPDDAAVVIIPGPKKPLFREEVASLETYMGKGGKIEIFIDPYLENEELRIFLEKYGIRNRQDIVIDELSRVFGGSYLMPVVTQYGAHKITEGFDVATFYPEARSVSPLEKPPEGVQVETLASTSPNAWSETNLELLKQGKADFNEEEDEAGPVSLMALAKIDIGEKETTEDEQDSDESQDAPEDDRKSENLKKGYLLVCGDSDFVDNTHFGLSGNGDFFLNTVNFLAEEENLITIEPRAKEGQPLVLTQNQARMFFWITLVFAPLMVLVSGLTVYRVRRSQR